MFNFGKNSANEQNLYSLYSTNTEAEEVCLLLTKKVLNDVTKSQFKVQGSISKIEPYSSLINFYKMFCKHVPVNKSKLFEFDWLNYEHIHVASINVCSHHV